MKKLLGFFAVIIPILVILIVVLTSKIVGVTVDLTVKDIELNTASGTVLLNTLVKIDYDIFPSEATNKGVYFESSDENIAIVDQSGAVKFVGFGQVIITVTTVDAGKSESCEFNIVSDNAYGINLMTNKAEIGIAEEAKLSAIIFPSSAKDKRVVYESLDESVATVDVNGIVTGVGCGIAEIEVYTYDKNVKQTISIAVTQKASSLVLSSDSEYSYSGIVRLNTKFYPANTSEKYKKLQYVSSDNSVASVNNMGIVKFEKIGKVEIEASTAYGVTSSVTLYNTGGYPIEVGCSLEDGVNMTYDELDNDNNMGSIPIYYSTGSFVHAISFKSLNENIVKVDELGDYIVVGGGTVTVQVTAKIAKKVNDDLIIENKTFVVAFNIKREVQTLDFLQDNVSISSNLYRINTNISPIDATNKTLTYQSSDTNIAMVDDGNVVFKKEGTVVVTVSSINGKSAEITISSSFGYPSDASFNNYEKYIKKGTSKLLGINLMPSSATANGTWGVADNSILTIDERGNMIALKNGETTVSYVLNIWNDKLGIIEEKTISNQVVVYTSVSNIYDDLDLEKDGANYITAQPFINLNYNILPIDATVQKVELLCTSDIVHIDNKTAYFKDFGIAEFTLKCYDIKGDVRETSFVVEYVNGIKSANIKLESKEIQLYIGDSLNIELDDASIVPKNVNDKNFLLLQTGDVLSINGNKITAKSSGNGVLIVRFKNGYQLRIAVNVKQQIETINIRSTTSDDVTIRREVALNIEVKPQNVSNRSVLYESLNEEIAVVDQFGNVRFLQAGEVVIKVTAVDDKKASNSIRLRSTFGGIETFTTNSEIFVHETIGYELYPSDALPSDVSFEILEQTSNDGYDVLRIFNGNLVGNTVGSAKVKFSYKGGNGNNIDSIITFNCTFTPANDISDFVLKENNVSIYEGETVDIRENILQIMPTDIDQRYIDYMEIRYSVDSAGVVVDNDILSANQYGIYKVSIFVYEVEKTMIVNVFKRSEDIIFENIGTDYVNDSSYLCYEKGLLENGDYENILITSKSIFSLGLPEIENINPNYDSGFYYDIDKQDVASIDVSGNIVFHKEGLIKVSVYQNINKISKEESSSVYRKNFNKISKEEISSVLSFVVNIRYYNNVQSADFAVNGTVLNKTGTTEFNYDENGNSLEYACQNVFPKVESLDVVVSIESFDSNDNGKEVLRVNGLKIEILTGGTAIIKVVVGDSVQYYNFEIIRNVEVIEQQDDIFISNSVFKLPNANILPADATNKAYKYTCSNVDIATIEKGIITFKQAGEVVISVIADDNNNIMSTYKIKSTFGGIEDFVIDESTTINKGDSLIIEPSLLPSDATKFDVTYTLESCTANAGLLADVVELTQNNVLAKIGGTAIVKVSAVNAFGVLIEKFINITVIEEVEFFEIEKLDIGDYYEGKFTTARKSVQLSLEVLPLSATRREYQLSSSDTNIAIVNSAGLVEFKARGYVTITATLVGNPLITNSVNFHYVADQAVSVLIDELVTTLDVGQEISIVVKEIMPSDMTKLFKIEIISSIINGGEGAVVEILNGNTIKALSGGSVIVRVVVSGFVVVDNHQIIIKSPITSISGEGDINLQDYATDMGRIYDIDVEILPIHADKEVGYEIISGENISVDKDGKVTFTGFSVSQIKVYSQANPNVYAIININYVKTIRTPESISVNSPEVLFAGVDFTFIVTAIYSLDDEVLNNKDVTFVNNNSELISLNKEGVATALDRYGEAIISVSYLGKTQEIKFIVVPVIDSMAFSLTAAGDNVGIKGERVFGIKSFLSDELSLAEANLTNKFRMTLSATTTIPDSTPLVWTSSDHSIATVDEFGIVTFLKQGNVTISCAPLYPYSEEEATYTFKVVNGVNVYSVNQFDAFTVKLTNNAGMITQQNAYSAVLHTDIIYNSSHRANFWNDSGLDGDIKYRSFRALPNIHGNGHTIDASNGTRSTYDSFIAFQIFTSDTLIDNVTLIGGKFEYPSEPNLADLETEPVVLAIRGYGNSRVINNITVANSTIMTGSVNIMTYSAQYTLTGCHIKDAYMGNLEMNAFSIKKEFPSIATVRNCVFENSLTPSIHLKVDKEGILPENSNKLTIEGDIYINNWRSEADIPKGLDGSYSTVLKEVFKEFGDRGLLYDGGYINMSIMRLSIKKFTNYGTIDYPENIDYMSSLEIEKRIWFALATIILDSYDLNKIPTLPGLSGPLVPGTVITSAIYPFIRDRSI